MRHRLLSSIASGSRSLRAGLAVLALAVVPAWAKSFTWAPDSAGRTQVELYLDPYYSAVNYTHPLSRDSIREFDSDGERALYWSLLYALPFPHDVLFEMSANPLPLAGVAIRENAPGFYRDASIRDVRIVQAVTEDYPDPWAFSVFFGNVARLVSKADSGKLHGIGYSGILASMGNRHIAGNVMVPDKWLELELKLKGEDIRASRNLSWSFRGGLILHGNDDIVDAFCLSVKRSRTDFHESGLLLLRNSSAEFRVHLAKEDLSLMDCQLVIGKKFPMVDGKFALTLDLGVIRQISSGYRGTLAARQSANWKLVLRPNVDF